MEPESKQQFTCCRGKIKCFFLIFMLFPFVEKKMCGKDALRSRVAGGGCAASEGSLALD
jgi:hypothetical protein